MEWRWWWLSGKVTTQGLEYAFQKFPLWPTAGRNYCLWLHCHKLLPMVGRATDSTSVQDVYIWTPGTCENLCYVNKKISADVIVQSLSTFLLFATPWTEASQASLSITNSQSLLRLMSIKLVMPSNYFILCHHLFLLPSIFPSIWVFPNESVLCIRWPKYWSFSFNIHSSNEYSRLISFRMDWLDLLAI